MIYIDHIRLFASLFYAYYIIGCIHIFRCDDRNSGARTNSFPTFHVILRALLIKRVLDCPPQIQYSDPADNYKGVPMTPLHLLIFFHSAWQELHQVIFAQVVSPFLVVFSGFSTETSTKTATRRANTKPKGGYVLFHGVCAYVQILLFC